MTDFRIRWPLLSALKRHEDDNADATDATPEARAAAVIRALNKAKGLTPVPEPEPGSGAASVVAAYRRARGGGK